MLSLTRDALATVVQGECKQSAERMPFQGVEYDSREIKGGELFIALKGSKSHGHIYVEEVLKRGAALCLVEDRKLLDTCPTPERLIVVPDTLKAFWTLASWWRKELKIPVLAVTGSVGKTTVKEIAASILLQHSRGTYSLKSHNNHVGVPYTICRIARDHQWVVLEMGMNHPGEIRVLTDIAKPDVALITAIAPAHIEAFSSIEQIVAAKFEITEGLSEKGILILNGDDTRLLEAGRKWEATGKKARYFGSSKDCDVVVGATTTCGLDGIQFELTLFEKKLAIKMAVLGKHNALNAAAAVLGVRALLPEIGFDLIERGLTDFRAPLMRLQTKKLSDGKLVIDDSYNANPTSMRALLDIARDLKGDNLRVGLMLGDMLELGQDSPRYHAEIGKIVASMKPAFLIVVGSAAKVYFEEAKKEGVTAFLAESPEAAGHIAEKLNFDILLVKASRGIGLDRAVQTLAGE